MSDRISKIKDAFDRAQKGDWSVWREDSNGNEFCMIKNVAEESADDIIRVMTEEIHKQTYWKSKVNPS